MDLEPLARKALPPAHWCYMTTGVDDNFTLRSNREAFEHYQLRARRLVDVSEADLKTEIADYTPFQGRRVELHCGRF
jgi:isopentenyl diphosphate isomerase/L-lactate dehydrogenase-like FMN-dependent dehydrogenase